MIQEAKHGNICFELGDTQLTLGQGVPLSPFILTVHVVNGGQRVLHMVTWLGDPVGLQFGVHAT